MIEFIALLLLLMPLGGLWVTWKMWTWHQFYQSRFLWGLFLASISTDLASVPVAVISANRLFRGPNAPPFPQSGLLLGFSVLVLEGVFLYLVLRWRDLDKDMKVVRTGRMDETFGVNREPTDKEND